MTTSTPAERTASQARSAVPLRKRATSFFASTVGNLLEWFDWAVYAAMSPFIAAAMFDPADPTSALLSTLAVFAVGFAMRPVGGIVFGIIANRRGRKLVLIVTMVTMAVATLAIVFIPTYAQIGVWSSVLLVAVRLVQGFAHGGETAINYSYVTEIAPPAHRGLWSSGILGCVIAGSMLANGVAGLLTLLSPAGFVAAGGWRIPFVLGAAMGVYALFLRRSMMESDVYERASATSDPDTPGISSAALPRWSAGKVVGRATLLILFVAGGSIVQYTWTAYAGTYAISEKQMDPSAAYWASFVAQGVGLLLMPFWGWLSDRIGRRPLIVTYGLITAALIFPLFSAIGSDWWSLLLPATLIFAIWGMIGSLSPAIQAEQVTTRYRAPVIGATSSIAAALFGGTAPYLIALFASLGLEWVFLAYIALLCLVTAVVILCLKETKGVSLDEV